MQFYLIQFSKYCCTSDHHFKICSEFPIKHVLQLHTCTYTHDFILSHMRSKDPYSQSSSHLCQLRSHRDGQNNKHTHPPDQLIWLYQKNIAGSIFILSLLCTAFASAKMVQSRQVFRSGFMVLSKEVNTLENMSKKTKVFFSAFMAIKEAFIFTCTWIFCVYWQPQLQTWCITTVHVLGDCSCETNKKMNSLFTFCCHYSLSNGEIKVYQGKHII